MFFRTKKRPDGSSYVHPIGSSPAIRKGKKTLGKNRFKVKVKAEVPETEDKEETERVESTSDVAEQEEQVNDSAEGNDVEHSKVQKEAEKVEAE